MSNLLLIDDDASFCQINQTFLEQKGYNVNCCHSGTEGIAKFKEKSYDVVLTDLCMKDMNGIQVLKEIMRIDPKAVVIIVTGHGDIVSAVAAMKIGAFDYIEKPLTLEGDELLVKLEKAVEKKRLSDELQHLYSELTDKSQFSNIIGKGAKMVRVFELIKTVAATDTTVLIRGETGTGKEMVARAIHFNGARHRKPFMVINCPAFNETLLESELFGHEKGAFTGAHQQHKGKFEYADGGTIFLDEVAELPINIQTKLLRVLQFKEFQRVGGNENIKTDIRLIAATNQDLEASISAGKFRPELFYRLNVFEIQLPPLRERKEDIQLLVERFIRDMAPKLGKEITGVAPEALETLLNYHWPGNVRELENIIERSILLEEGPLLGTIHLIHQPVPQPVHEEKRPAQPVNMCAYEEFTANHMRELEKNYFEKLLVETKGRINRASEISGLNRRTLYRKLIEHGINKKKFKP